MTEEDRIEAGFVKGLFIGLFALSTFIIIGMALQQWRQMDCRTTLGQNGRTSTEINEICR